MKTPRRSITATLKIEALFALGQVTCAMCGGALRKEETDWDHIWPLSLGGPHKGDNLRPLHRACHKKPTKRLKRDLAHVNRINGTTLKTRKGRPFPPGRPLQSKPFPKPRKAKPCGS